MEKLRIGKTAVEGLRIFFSRFGTALKIGWVPLIIAIAIQFTTLFLILPRIAGVQTSESAFTYDPNDEMATLDAVLDAVGQLIAEVGWISVLLWLIGMVVYAMLAVAWLRFCLLGDNLGRRPGLLRFGGREVKTAFAYILWGLIYAVLVIVAVLIGAGLSQLSGWLSAVIVIPLSVVVFFWMMRLMMVFPLIALDQGMRWRVAWQLTRGNSWRLIGAFCLAGLLLLVIMMVPSVIVGLAAFAVEPGGGINVGFLGIVNGVVQQILGIFAIMVLLGTLAEAYRQLGGPGIGVPEDVLAVFDD